MPKPDVSDERKPQIIAAAIRVFLRDGYRKATMPAVAREAGLSIGGLYWYYKSKDEIVAAILEQLFQEDLEALALLAREDTPAAERIRLFTAGYIQAYPAYAWLDSLGVQFYAEAVHDPRVRAIIQRYLGHYRQALTTLIEQGIRRGEFRSVPAADLANVLLGLEEGLALLSVADPGGIQRAEAFQLAIDLLLAGLALSTAQLPGKEAR